LSSQNQAPVKNFAFAKMNWQFALAIPITFTGFLLLLESIEEMLNHLEGGAGGARPEKRAAPTLVLQPAANNCQDITKRVEWPLPWATLDVDYSEKLAHMDQSSPRLVDRSHVAQLPFQEKAAVASGSGGGSAFAHLQGVKVRDLEECY
jgi:hypothetical protein